MHYQSNRNPDLKFYTMEALRVAQEEAIASGDPVKRDEVFQLTWMDDTSTDTMIQDG